MWQQAKQVGMTYVTRRWPMVGMLVVVLLCVVAPLVYAMTGDEAEPMQAMLLCGVVGALTFWLATTAKWQFAHPRSRLTPRFSGPHVGMLAVSLIAGVGLFPLLIAWMSNTSFLGLAAMTAVMACCQIWLVYRGSELWSLVPMSIFFSMPTSWGLVFWTNVERPVALVHAGLLTAAWGGLLFWLWRLPHLHEELPEYQPLALGLPTGTSRLRRRQERRQAAQRLIRHPLMARFVDRWHDRISEYPQSPRRRAAWLLRYGSASTPTALRAAAFATVYAVVTLGMVLFYFLLSQSPGSVLQGIRSTSFMLLFASWISVGMVVGTMATRWPRLGGELLRPLSRVQFVEGLLRSLGLDVAVFWLALNMAVLGVISIASPSSLETRTVATFLTLSFSIQPVLLSVNLWLLTRWGQLGIMLVGTWAPLPSMAIYALWWFKRTDWGDGVFVLGALAMALCGLAMLARVRRRWLNLEFG